MKVVLDTNVLISATFWEGDSSKIVKKVEDKEIELILSKDILDEFKSVLEYKEILEIRVSLQGQTPHSTAGSGSSIPSHKTCVLHWFPENLIESSV